MWQETAVIALLATATLLGHGATLDYWWWLDDSQILRHAVQWPLWQIYAVPAVWRDLVPYSFTPWLSTAYAIDWLGFGLEPRGYYAHGLAAVGVCAWLIYRLLLPRTGYPLALAGGLLFLAGAPVATATQQLMVRHYVEGLAFLLLALWLARRAHDTSQSPAVCRRQAWLSGGAFGLALMAKEIFLPLGALILMFPAPWSTRLRVALPWALAGAIYLPWRGIMLGDLVGGYAPIRSLLDGARLSGAASQLGTMAERILTGPGLAVAAMTGALMLVTSAPRYGKHFPRQLLRTAAQTVVVVALLVGPLMPLALAGVVDQLRFFIVPWAAFVGAFCLAVARLAPVPGTRRRLALLLPLTLGFAVLPAQRASQASDARLHAKYAALGQVLLRGGDRDVLLIDPEISPHYPAGMVALRPAAGQTSAPPALVGDPVELAAVWGKDRGLRLWRSDGNSPLTEATAEVPGLLAEWRNGLRSIPLDITLSYDPTRRILAWSFESAEPGRFSLIHQGRLDLPARNVIRFERPLPVCFRIRFEANAGGYTYTPQLRIEPSDTNSAPELHWRGVFTDPDMPGC